MIQILAAKLRQCCLPFRNSLKPVLCIVWLLPLLSSFLTPILSAQTVSAYTGTTPAAFAPGSPRGSYPLSGFENYSPFGGTLSPSFLLHRVGGRGETAIDLYWNIPTIWSGSKVNDFPQIAPPASLPSRFQPLLVGQVFARTAVTRYTGCGAGHNSATSIITRMVFVDANGTQTELLDANTNGTPFSPPNYFDCSNSDSTWNGGRGTVFVSRDGRSSLKFVADATVMDTFPITFDQTSSISGFLYFPNGKVYRIDNTLVSWIRDRNGNRVFLQYDEQNRLTQISDSLDRLTTINRNDVSCGGCTTVTYPGTDGANRVIQIYTTNLSNALRSGFSIQTDDALFPEATRTGSSLPGGSLGGNSINPIVTSAIQYPDGQRISLQYNSYAELARVNLPTGGVVEYDFGSGDRVWGDSGYIEIGGAVIIYRRLLERREYANGSSVSSKTVFTASSDNQDTKVTDLVYDANNNLLSSTVHSLNGSPINAAQLTGTGCNYWREGFEFQTDVGIGVLRTIRRTPTQTGNNCTNDPHVTSETTTLGDSNQVSAITYAYDDYNNVKDKYEYDWGTGNPGTVIRHTATTFVTGPTYVDRHLIRLPSQSAIYEGEFTRLAALSYYGYDETALTDASTAPGHDPAYVAGFTTRGNLTTTRRWKGVQDEYISEKSAYNSVGNVVSQTDGNGNITTHSYTDGAFVKPNVITNALSQTTTAAYDRNTQELTSATDTNGMVTEYSYADALDRLTQVRRAVGGGPAVDSSTTYTYYTPTLLITKTDQKQTNDGMLRNDVYTDGFGRVTQRLQYEDSGAAYIGTTTTYDALGRVTSTTNPSRPGDNLGSQTIYVYDSLGRPTSVVHPGGATETMAYFGDRTTVTDPAGKTKSYNYDAIGRLVKVIEHPNEPESTADYGYDPLDNLISVKHGRHPNWQYRNFTYDTLSRLVEAKNPESGTIHYAYDEVGSLIRRTDNGLINTTYVYDKLNRLREKTYSDTTPQVSYTYDEASVPNSKGRLTKVSSSKSGTNVSMTSMAAYDALGQVTASSQTTSGHIYNFGYTYNLAGALTSETYPSGRKVEISYDAVNRPITVQSNGLPYLTDVKYAPHGSPSQYRYGNNLLRSMIYNNRLQTATMKDIIHDVALWDASLNYGAANNNGNLQSETTVHSVGGPPGNPRYPLTLQASYGYDSLNRLTNVAATGFSIRYGYDAWNNMWVPEPPAFSANGLTPRDNVYEATNRMRGLTYDSAGNLQTYGAKSIIYDAENKQSTVTESAAAGGGQVSYAYDGDGQRVMKTIGADSTVYVYDIFGHLAAEYTNYSAPEPPCTTCYLSIDHLGSTRLVTDASANVISRHDYLPFGEEIPSGVAGRTSEWGSTTDVRQKFTGKERDKETGLDYFGARYMSSAQGRFMSPDEPWNDQYAQDPQSWNLYSYGRNNPLKYTDPTGQAVQVCTSGESGKQTCVVMSDGQYASAIAGRNPGINAPAAGATAGVGHGLAVGGVITCGGLACGSATYQEESMQDTTGDLVAITQIGTSLPSLVRGSASLGQSLAKGIAGLFLKEAGAVAKVTVQDILQGAFREGGSRTDIFSKGGGFTQATKDFESLEGSAQTVGAVRIKNLPNGQGRVVLRNFSSDGRPTLEIQPAGGGYKGTAIRYNP